MEYFEIRNNGYNFILDELSNEFIDSIASDTFYDSLMLVMLNYETNKEDLSKMVHKRFHEFAIVPRWKGFWGNGKGIFYTGISEEFIDAFDLDKDKIFRSAYKNTLEKSGFKMRSVDSYLENLCFGHNILDIEDTEPEGYSQDELYLVTNSRVEYGAVYLYIKEVMEDIYEKLGRSYFVIPSSVDELLVFCEMPFKTPEAVKTFIKSVNDEVVSRKEYLSDNLYYYDGDTKELSII